MPLSPEIEARLCARFNAKLPALLDDLERVMAQLEAGRPEGWAQACYHAHQVAGTAASFGWPEMTNKARSVLEAPQDAGLAALVVLLEEVRRSVEQWRASAGPDREDDASC